MEPFEPQIENPYPRVGWTQISGFEYETPLHLYRGIKAVQRRKGEDADYVVGRDYTVRFKLDNEDEERRITVPRGMLTDLSSVPKFARSVIGRVGPHLEASIVHDFLYIAWQDLGERGPQDEDREFADELLRVAMEKAGVSRSKRFLIHKSVKLGGGGAYRRKDDPRYVEIPAEEEEEEEEAEAIAPSTGEAEAIDVNTDPQS